MLALQKELGQVWTPEGIATEMVSLALGAAPNCVEILDPSCGPATFAKALHKVSDMRFNLTCYDVDSRMVELTKQICSALKIETEVIEADYLLQESLEKKYDLIIMNPPYIRQESIKNKNKYHSYLEKSFSENIDKRSNLFVLFILKGLIDLKDGGIMCAIVYDAISQTRYGKKTLNIIKNYMDVLSTVAVEAPFNDVIVDAQILLLKKRNKIDKLKIAVQESSYVQDGHVPLEKLLKTRRGACFPQRDIFIASSKDPYFEYSVPIFVKQSTIPSLVVEADKRAYLLKENGGNNEKLVSWLEAKAAKYGKPSVSLNVPSVKGPILFNYYVRENARHLWNPSNINAADNFYVSSVLGEFPSEAAWLLLNSDLYKQMILSAGREQGNGLKKLQLYEYRSAVVPDWRILNRESVELLVNTARILISKCGSYDEISTVASELAYKLFK